MSGDYSIAYGGAGGAVSESGTIVFASWAGGGKTTFSEIEQIKLKSDAPDGTVHGSSGNDVIGAGYNDDVNNANGDVIDGGDGSIAGNASADDIIVAGAGSDSVEALDGDDTIFAGSGDDTVDAGYNDDLIYGAEGNDTLGGMSGNDTIYGGSGDDLITRNLSLDLRTNEDNDLVYGGLGRDTIVEHGDGEDTIYGGSGDDSISITNTGTVLNGEDILYGGTGNDTINHTGRAEDDNGAFYGESGDDDIFVGAGNDVAYGGIGDDIIKSEIQFTRAGDFTSGDDLMYGGSGDDTIMAAGGNDTQFGGTGTDTFIVGKGNDVIVGGENSGDNDILDLSGLSGEASVAYAGGDNEAGTVTLANGNKIDFPEIEKLVGAAPDGTVHGNNTGETMGDGYNDDVNDANGDVIGDSDGSHVDIILGMGGNDEITAGQGTDTVFGGAGEDEVFGGSGEDFMQGDSGDDSLYGGIDNDRIYDTSGDDLLYGGEGDDTLYTTDGNDTLYGGENDDSVYAIGINEVLYGGSGDDRILVTGRASGDATLYGGDGDDTISSGGSGVFDGVAEEIFYGGAGNDYMSAKGDDNIFYVSGDDTVVADEVGSTGGNDTIIVNTASSAIINGGERDDDADIDVLDLSSLTGQISTIIYEVGSGNENGSVVFGNGETLEFENIETLLGAPDGTVHGEDTAELMGAGYNDALQDNDQNGDVIGDGGPVGGFDNHNDIILGNGGDDTIYAGSGEDTVYGGDDNDLVFGGSGDDTLSGDLGNDSVYGGIGNDSMWGGYGNDVVYGGTGVDDVRGAFGADLVYGGSGDDTVRGHGGAEDDNDTLYGGDGNDLVVDNGGDDVFYGGAGNDTLDLALNYGDDTQYGESGDDVLNGGTGDDLLFGGQGNDIAYAGDNDDVVEGGSGDDLVYAGDGRDTIEGEIGSDTIRGGAQDDSIYGGQMDDDLCGDSGDDLIYGDDGPTPALETHTYNIFDENGGAKEYVDTGTGERTTVSMSNNSDWTVETQGGVQGLWQDTDTSTSPTSTIGFTNEVTNVSFDLFDLDQDLTGPNTFDDAVQIFAYDALGNPVQVTVLGTDISTSSVGSGVQIDSEGADNVASNVTIMVAGPVASIEVVHVKGDDNSPDPDTDNIDMVGFNELTFEIPTSNNDTIRGKSGEDSLYGNQGADEMFGGNDNDLINTGSGDDVAFGGQGSDTFQITTGDSDTIVGNEDAGDTDFDVLDLSGLNNEYSIEYAGGDNEDGSVIMEDAGGSPTGETLIFSDIENIICFARGTHIATAMGEVAVEDLQVGDMVNTMDNGVQQIRWIGKRTVPATGKLAPVVFKAGALGNTRDLRVSPQHRMLVNDWRAETLFGEFEVLSAAKHFVNGDTIFVEESDEVEYFHVLFDSHEIVFAEGAASESFHPGEVGAEAVDPEQFEELMTLFPELRENLDAYGAAARMSLKSHEGRMIAKEIFNK